MALSEDLQVLSEFGIFNEEAVARLAGIVRLGIQAFSAGKPAAAAARPVARAAGKRALRGSFNPTKDEISKLRQDGMTAKAISEKYGVSVATVNLRLKKFGLTTPRKAKAGKK
jgi:DNA-binding NarL/FixJ family response regulator